MRGVKSYEQPWYAKNSPRVLIPWRRSGTIRQQIAFVQQGLYLHQQGIDTTSPAGKAMFQMCGVFAEFERAMIRERVKVGLERAQTQSKTLGRPRTPKVVENKIRAERRKGKGIKKIAGELGIGISTVQRVVHE